MLDDPRTDETTEEVPPEEVWISGELAAYLLGISRSLLQQNKTAATTRMVGRYIEFRGSDVSTSTGIPLSFIAALRYPRQLFHEIALRQAQGESLVKSVAEIATQRNELQAALTASESVRATQADHLAFAGQDLKNLQTRAFRQAERILELEGACRQAEAQVMTLIAAESQSRFVGRIAVTFAAVQMIVSAILLVNS